MDVEGEALRRLGRANGDSDAVLDARVAGGWGLLGALTRCRFGLIDSGLPADVVVGAPGERPRHVLVDGRPVVVDGALVTADLEEIRAHAREEAPRLWARMNEIGAAA